ncbi:MAG TPA: hypothetical protein IAB65_01655 [Candidatus Onthocola stercorigallinarum]|nr:hypothetical protein [Candidatus Onthocola stercorigallinarum]
MKKKILLLSSVLLILIIIVSIVFIINKNNTNGLVLENKEEAKEQITGSNWLSMMYETGPGTGEYSESKSSLWPESGYIFNENLSGCENGGELSWNDDLGAVTLHSNKSDSCYVYFDAYIIPVINSVTTSNIETDSITLTVSVTNGNNLVTTYYYSNNNGTSYVSSNSNTYTFNGLDIGTEYSLSVYVEDSEGYKSEIYNLSETTDDAVLLANYIKGLYTADGVNNLYYHDGQGSYTNANQEAQDNSYRYAGANPNNYVCFGSDASTCPSDNLYRIIGVFDNQVKLIMADYPTINQTGTNGNYYDVYSSNYQFANRYIGNRNLILVGMYGWDPTEENLNNAFLASLTDEWKDKISTSIWYVGGASSGTAKSWYFEDSKGNNISTKIGLMYASDYGYAANPSAWTSMLLDYDDTAIKNSNWMFLGLDEWIFSNSPGCGIGFAIGSNGVVGDPGSEFCQSYYFSIRPVFYLTSDVAYSSGSGTSSDPIKIVV